MNMAGATLRLKDLQVFRDVHGAEKRLVVDRLSIELGARDRLVLAGPNGAGKTSVLLAIVGALSCSGQIEVDELLVNKHALTAIRRRVALVFADPSEQFFLPTVREEIAFAPKQQQLMPEVVEARVQHALTQVGLCGFEQRQPGELSLGEQRRLAIACALAMQPSVMLLDEPTASLDPKARRAMLDVIRKVEATVLIATHDLDAALEIGSRVLLLDAGRFIAEGPAALILEDGELLRRAGLDYPLSVAARKRDG